jgi:drug/metabolite transporter (DMT)-like permease
MSARNPSFTSSESGWLNGLLGVAIFSASLPATRVAVLDLDPHFLTYARAAIAGLLGLVLLMTFQERRPRRGDLLPLMLVALGVVVGFPLLTAFALRQITSAHATAFIGLLPLSTAIFGTLRGGERPPWGFWIFALAGSGLVLGYSLCTAGAGGSLIGDLLMVAAILVCGLGYAEGARLSRTLGGWQVISWALVLALPLMLPLALLNAPGSWAAVSWSALAALVYVSLFSMLIGFVFWYRGLALGGIAAVGQLQLVQPFLSLILAAALLHEPVGWPLFGVAAGVVVCVAGAKRLSTQPR